MIEPIYENKWVKLYQGDCLEIMPQLDITFDACITDPPYGTTACKWDSVIPFEDMWKNLKRLVKSNGAICLFGSEPFSSSLRMSNLEMFKYDLVWEKSKSSSYLLAKNMPLKSHEIISLFYTKQCTYNPIMGHGKPYIGAGRAGKKVLCEHFGKVPNPTFRRDNHGTRFPRSVLYFKTYESEKDGIKHPSRKPLPLMEYLIKTYTNEGEIVLDFTCGSGTTGVAAMETNRKAVLIEKEPKYCEITIKRIQDKEKEIAERLF